MIRWDQAKYCSASILYEILLVKLYQELLDQQLDFALSLPTYSDIFAAIFG